jgi:hypothetical protein
VTKVADEALDCGCVEAAIGFLVVVSGLALVGLINHSLAPVTFPKALVWILVSLLGASAGKVIGLSRRQRASKRTPHLGRN